MKNITFIVEDTNTGFSAYAEDEEINVATTGSTLDELRENALEAINLLQEHNGLIPYVIENIILKQNDNII